MTDIRFEDPPPRKAGPGGTDPRSAANAYTADTLRARRGEWALISIRATQRRASSYAYGIRTGMLHAFRPAGAFEAKARTVGKQHRVYARYVGDTPAGGEQA
jgi:hypothetical protein